MDGFNQTPEKSFQKYFLSIKMQYTSYNFVLGDREREYFLFKKIGQHRN